MCIELASYVSANHGHVGYIFILTSQEEGGSGEHTWDLKNDFGGLPHKTVGDFLR